MQNTAAMGSVFLIHVKEFWHPGQKNPRHPSLVSTDIHNSQVFLNDQIVHSSEDVLHVLCVNGTRLVAKDPSAGGVPFEPVHDELQSRPVGVRTGVVVNVVGHGVLGNLFAKKRVSILKCLFARNTSCRTLIHGPYYFDLWTCSEEIRGKMNSET